MAGSGAPRRGDVTKGIIRDAVVAIKEVTDLRAALNSRLASLQDARRPRAVRSTAKQGRGMPRRGDIKKQIGKEVVRGVVKAPMKLFESAGKLISNRAPQPGLDSSSDLRRVDVPTREPGTANEPHETVLELSATHALELGMVNEPHGPVLELAVTQAPERGAVDVPREQAAKPVLDLVTQSSGAPPTTSIQAVDGFLQASPIVTKKDAIVKQWPKVDMSRALEHEGSILYQDKAGKWIAESCCDYSDTVLVPLTVPSVPVPIPL